MTSSNLPKVHIYSAFHVYGTYTKINPTHDYYSVSVFGKDVICIQFDIQLDNVILNDIKIIESDFSLHNTD